MAAAITLKELKPNFNIIDIRSAIEFQTSHVTGAVSVPYEILMTYPDSYLKKGECYYLVCAHGTLSRRACAILQSYGYNTISVKDGYDMRCYYYC